MLSIKEAIGATNERFKMKKRQQVFVSTIDKLHNRLEGNYDDN